ncbi:AP2-like ethylene-responsive transcription factor [Artemisia annua]|uniref:AP2-like ethylene-responsive transcription factor n=1 Tax=Artemisia annua TaxID=35608 RepID=A0A2U1PA75_ARTAN|nr:AP2-like ethylene-responsive transcription factor [Artemisia annua]
MNTNSVVVTKAKRTRKTVPRDSPPRRSSIYRGVTRHRWTGRYEAHLWDKNCWNESQNKKGRQALKYWGPDTILNFPLMTYHKELKQMEGQSREEYIGSLRRKSSGFSRGVSKYRGVARHHHNGRWEARIGRVFGNKYLYLGTYATQEEAAVAYDMAAIEYRGLNAVTNFDLSRYIKWLRPDNNNTTDAPPNPNINIFNASLPPSSNHEIEINYLQNHNETQPLQLSEDAVSPTVEATMTYSSRSTSATSALGLLLQSSKFKEMMEMTTAAEFISTSSNSTVAPTCNKFPEEIQVHFESQDFGGYNGGDDFIFGDMNFMHNMLHSDFEK